eukprot:m.45734 g.45734  ORF g.45734 m.45734 type:complete len:233 (-) comp6261_c0_seq1:354-1052(-)
MGNLVTAPTVVGGTVRNFFVQDSDLREIDRKVEATAAAADRRRRRQEQQTAEYANQLTITDTGDALPSQILSYLFLGDRLSACDSKSLKADNIGFVLQLSTTETPEVLTQFYKELGIEYMRLPVEDETTYNIINDFDKANAFINKARKASRKGDPNSNCLVFSARGEGRGAAIVMAYLLDREYNLKAAANLVKAARPSAVPRQSFFDQLVEREKSVLGSNSLSSADHSKVYA